MSRKFFTPFVLGTALAVAACAEEPSDAPMDDAAMADEMVNADAPGTIVDVAVSNSSFSTLVAAVQAAGLVETLSGEGPFTVFAPVDDAFAALPEGTVDNLVTNDTETLGAILTYHVVAGEVMAADVLSAIEAAGDDGFVVETVNGATLTATLVDGSVVLTDAAGGSATVTATDVDASNGVIHVIDTVLMPG